MFTSLNPFSNFCRVFCEAFSGRDFRPTEVAKQAEERWNQMTLEDKCQYFVDSRTPSGPGGANTSVEGSPFGSGALSTTEKGGASNSGQDRCSGTSHEVFIGISGQDGINASGKGLRTFGQNGSSTQREVGISISGKADSITSAKVISNFGENVSSVQREAGISFSEQCGHSISGKGISNVGQNCSSVQREGGICISGKGSSISSGKDITFGRNDPVFQRKIGIDISRQDGSGSILNDSTNNTKRADKKNNKLAFKGDNEDKSKFTRRPGPSMTHKRCIRAITHSKPTLKRNIKSSKQIQNKTAVQYRPKNARQIKSKKSCIVNSNSGNTKSSSRVVSRKTPLNRGVSNDSLEYSESDSSLNNREGWLIKTSKVVKGENKGSSKTVNIRGRSTGASSLSTSTSVESIRTVFLRVSETTRMLGSKTSPKTNRRDAVKKLRMGRSPKDSSECSLDMDDDQGCIEKSRRPKDSDDRQGKGRDDRGDKGRDDRRGRGSYDRGGKGSYDRGGKGSYDRGANDSYDRGGKGSYDRGRKDSDDRGGKGSYDRGRKDSDDRGGKGSYDRGGKGSYDRGGNDSDEE